MIQLCYFSTCFAQEPEDVAPAFPQQPELQLPVGAKPTPGGGRRVIVRSPAGDFQVALLNCTIADKSLVTMPSGEISLVDQIKTKPTDQPFKASRKALAAAIQAAGLEEFKVTRSKPYIYVSDCSDPFLAHTQTIMESMYQGVFDHLKSWGLEIEDPVVPLVVVIMPSRKAFDEYFRVPREWAAYYNGLSNQVVLYEDEKLADAAPQYALMQASYVIAHEGVHQLLPNTGIQNRLSRWPMWITEGLPEYFCPLKIHTRIAKQGLAGMPVRSVTWTKAGMINQLRMRDLLRIRTKQGEVMQQMAQASQLNSNGYALAWGMVHYLVNKRPTEFRAYLEDLTKIGSLEGLEEPTMDPYFKKHFGDDFVALEKSVQQYVTSEEMMSQYKDPIANQTIYVIQRLIRKGSRQQLALYRSFSPAGARGWREKQEAEFPRAKFRTYVFEDISEAQALFRRRGARW